MRLKYTLPIAALTLGIALFPTSNVSAHSTNIHLSTLKTDGSILFESNISTANTATGTTLTSGDTNNDGLPEIILGSGLGNEPRVRIYNSAGSEISSFLAYAPNMGIGINVAACDLDGDGKSDIVTAPQRGGGPHIRAFGADGTDLAAGGFFAYTEAFRGGVNLACGDLDGDGRAELVTLPGTNGGPHVRVWKFSENTFTLADEFFAFGADDNRGLVGKKKKKKLFVAPQRGGSIDVVTYNLELGVLGQNTTEIAANGLGSIFFENEQLRFAGTSESGIFAIDGAKIYKTDVEFGSTTAMAVDLNNDGLETIIYTPYRPMFSDRTEPQYIHVDKSKQRVFAYEHGVLSNTFLVSTGRSGYSTPAGEHSVLAKPLFVNYAWSYGTDNPNNYDLGMIKYNLRIYPHIYIHYAPWHNNFGHVMSHGCVNVNLTNIQWIYEWAEVGTPVTVS